MEERMKSIYKVLTGVVLSLGIAGAVAPAQADPVNIRIGWSTMPGHLIPILYSKPEILKHYGTSYTVDTINFRGSSPQITAMAAGEIDMGAFAALPLYLAVHNAGLDVKLVADIIQDGIEGYNSEAYMVRTDSGIESVEDLRGKRIGTNAIGSASDTAMRAMLRQNGLDPTRDVQFVEVGFPNIPTMMEEGKLDMGTVIQPMAGMLEERGDFKALFRARDAVGPSQIVFLVARGEFLEANREQLLDFFEDHVRATRWLRDPENREEAIQMIADFVRQPPENLSHVFTERDYYRDPFMIPNVENLQRGLDLIHELEMVPTRMQLAPDHVDLSFVETAKERLEAEAGN
jgi:sulfonate transport system substrate-binding protein